MYFIKCLFIIASLFFSFHAYAETQQAELDRRVKRVLKQTSKNGPRLLFATGDQGINFAANIINKLDGLPKEALTVEIKLNIPSDSLKSSGQQVSWIVDLTKKDAEQKLVDIWKIAGKKVSTHLGIKEGVKLFFPKAKTAAAKKVLHQILTTRLEDDIIASNNHFVAANRGTKPDRYPRLTSGGRPFRAVASRSTKIKKVNLPKRIASRVLPAVAVLGLITATTVGGAEASDKFNLSAQRDTAVVTKDRKSLLQKLDFSQQTGKKAQ